MNERALYLYVEKEMNDGVVDEELWQKALLDNNGDEAAAQNEYIEFRVAQLQQDEINSQQQDEIIDKKISPVKKPVNKRNIIIGISVLFLLVISIVLIGFLLNDYFN